MSLFRRKRLAHQLVAEMTRNIFGKEMLRYRCVVCTLAFSSAKDANEEWCIGKNCYLTSAAAPQYLMRKEEIEATKRRVNQEPSAYVCNPYMMKKPIITPLYDVRECQELDGAIALPVFED